jgi:peptidoglycan/LPS O-acetylase OafA/YrhL
LKNRVYFPNLNAVRFIAAAWVIITHIEQVKSLLGMANAYDKPFVMNIGRLGVVLFFVLSGFLITYLLLEEEKLTGVISIRHFYLRRVLRIWPLYYFVAFLALFILPHFACLALPSSASLGAHFGLKLFLFCFFMPNLALAALTPVPYLSQSWSVGVEEQFYLIWPVLLKRLRGRRAKMLVGVVVLYVGTALALVILTRTFPDNGCLHTVRKFWYDLKVDCMALGGLAALMLFTGHRSALSILLNRYLQVAAYFVTGLLLATGTHVPFLNDEVYATLFAVIILNLAGNKDSVISLENRLLNYLGKVSYGIYMYHVLAIMLSLKLLLAMGIHSNVVLYLTSTLVVVFIASFSYELVEKRFIRLKIRYSEIVTGDNVEAAVPLPTAPSTKQSLASAKSD